MSDTAHHGQNPADLPDLSQVPLADRDRVWLEKYYQGDSMPQVTVRAILMGSLLGMMMSLSNLYIGLKTGWGLGVGITACILSYAIWSGLLNMRIARSPMSILENNCMQSTATSAGVSTGGTMVSAIAAQLASGASLPDAVARAKAYLTQALRSATQLDVGHGPGPVNHMWQLLNAE